MLFFVIIILFSLDFSIWARQSSKVRRPPSLRNIGANCYLNSALQGLSSCDQFFKEITVIHEEYIEVQNLSLFYKLMCILNGGSDGGCMEISRNPIFKNWNKPGQQDSFELLSYILNEVYKEIRKYIVNQRELEEHDLQSWLKIPLPMRIIIEYKIHCDCKSIIEVPLQSDLALHVSIPDADNLNLQEMVDRFFSDSCIEDYDCSQSDCKGKNAKRSTKLCLPLPRTICVHLQRARWIGNRMKKIDSKIKFSKQLTIRSKFLSDKCNVNSSNGLNLGKIPEKNHEMFNINENDTEMRKTDLNSFEFGEPDETDLNVSNDFDQVGMSSSTTTNTPQCQKNSIDEPRFDNGCETDDEKKNVNSKLERNSEICASNDKMADNAFGTEEDVEMDKESEVYRETITKSDNDNCGEAGKKLNVELGKVEIQDETFTLTSVIVHYGNVYSGHYVCYKCVNNQWFFTNDSRVDQVDEKLVFNCQAYILFYEKL